MSTPSRTSSFFSRRTTPSRPSHHANNSGTAFVNPWPSANAPTWPELLKASFPFGWYEDTLHSHQKAREVKVVRPDWGSVSLKVRGIEKAKSIIGTWLGHAGTLVEIPPSEWDEEEGEEEEEEEEEQKSVWLLFDPIFSERAGPTQYSGVARLKKSPCQIEDLPGCDAVFISHNHYDHLDLSSIKAVLEKFPKAKYFVPLGIGKWMSTTGVPAELIHELDWWQDREYSLSDFSHRAKSTTSEEDNQAVLKFSCVPAQHNSGRTIVDQGSTLWCGWVVERFSHSTSSSSPNNNDPSSATPTRTAAIYHAGDTGYRPIARSSTTCPAFAEIGSRFGPFDLSFIPIWRGGSLGFISSIGLRLSHHDVPSATHGSPTDAVAIHEDVRSRNSVGIHFGTFIGSEKESYDAVIEFGVACEESGVRGLDDDDDEDEKDEGGEEESDEKKKGRAGILDIGGSIAVSVA